MPQRAVFAGLATLDLAYLVDSYPLEDSKNLARKQFTAGGGPALNASVACAALSTESVLVTALGDHQLADLIRADLASHGVRVVDAAPEYEGPPPISSVVVAESTASRTVVSIDGSQTVALFDGRLARYLDDAAVLLVDGHHPEVAIGMATAARERGIPVILDAGRWKPVFAQLLPLVDIAICAAGFNPPGTSTLSEIRAFGPAAVAITNGAAPIQYETADSRGQVHIEPIIAIDSLGAGDILHGAFCHYFAEEQDIPRALAEAAKIATLSTQYFGTREWIKKLR